MEVKTERAISFVDEKVHDGVVVSHTFRTDEDGRRMTQFYLCGDQNQADTLIASLLNN